MSVRERKNAEGIKFEASAKHMGNTLSDRCDTYEEAREMEKALKILVRQMTPKQSREQNIRTMGNWFSMRLTKDEWICRM